MNEELIDAIQLMVEHYVKKAPYNRLLDGVIVDTDNDNKIYSVQVNGVYYEKVKPAHDEIELNVGDKVYVIIVNNDYSQKLILGRIGGGYKSDILDYENLPTTPVKIYRIGNNPIGKAYRFDYAFEGYPPEYQWSQVLHRDDNNKVYMISQFYSDGTALYFYLIRNEAGRLEYYGKNQFWTN